MRADRVPRTRSAQRRGGNAAAQRDHNMRLCLTLLREHGVLTRAEIARLTGLSAQASSVIVRELEGANLVRAGAPQRGRVGQPSVPMSINPGGAAAFGLHVGRRRAGLMLVDLLGETLSESSIEYDWPDPSRVEAFVLQQWPRLARQLPAAQRQGIAGLGIAMPFDLWEWSDRMGAPTDVAESWRNAPFDGQLSKQLPFPVYLQNDATAASGAEMRFESAPDQFACFFIDALIGGGIVLSHHLHTGRSGNAGALGSMLVCDGNGRVCQLLDLASLIRLEAAFRKVGIDPLRLWQEPLDWGGLERHTLTGEWIDQAAAAIAQTIVSCHAVLELDAVLLNGWMPSAVLDRLVTAVNATLDRLPRAGTKALSIRPGRAGVKAMALGAALLPLQARYFQLGLTARLGEGEVEMNWADAGSGATKGMNDSLGAIGR